MSDVVDEPNDDEKTDPVADAADDEETDHVADAADGEETEPAADGRDATGAEPLLRVEELEKHYPITTGLLQRETGRVRAVDGISFSVDRGETVGLIGESGCGKSTAATSLLRLEEPTGGRIVFDGEDVGAYDDAELRAFRRRAGMIFQDPTGSFDPRLTIGESVAEPLQVHGVSDPDTRRAVVEDLLERVELSAETFDRYPHKLSGGQKQRAALARSLVLNPDLLVADEPVSALDVSVQAEILALLDALQTDLGLGVVVISHDIDVVREICDRVHVMYLGEIVESGPTEAVLSDPQHPYTQALAASVPTPDPHAPDRDVTLSGDVPDAANPPSGCSFHPRCPSVVPSSTYDLDEDEWHDVFEFRLALAHEEIDRDALARRASVDPGTLDATTLRSDFDLPDRLGDEQAEAILQSGLEEAAAGNVEGAVETLEPFVSVCQRVDPEPRPTPAGRSVPCHLYEPEE